MSRLQHAGYTLTELLVTIGIAGLLAAVAAPNIGTFTRNGRLTDGVNDLLHSLQVARTEAIKRQAVNGVPLNVVVCGTNTPEATNPVCGYNTFRGWIVYADTNRNWQRDSGEEIIQRHDVIAASVTVKTDANANIVSYAPTGFANPTDPVALRIPTGTLLVCDSRGVAQVGNNATARVLFIATTGRARASASYSDVHDTALPLITGQGCP
jgi:type IV fimbrial biogenesis protein FimT